MYQRLAWPSHINAWHSFTDSDPETIWKCYYLNPYPESIRFDPLIFSIRHPPNCAIHASLEWSEECEERPTARFLHARCILKYSENFKCISKKGKSCGSLGMMIMMRKFTHAKKLMVGREPRVVQWVAGWWGSPWLRRDAGQEADPARGQSQPWCHRPTWCPCHSWQGRRTATDILLS